MSYTWWDGTGVDSATLRAEVERLAEEQPDKVAQCIYTATQWDCDIENVVPTSVVCIVGAAIFNITGSYVPESFEGMSINSNRWRSALKEPTGGDWHNIPGTSDDFLFVKRVQQSQDGGNTWGYALQRAQDDFS